mgnify:CR=1 FL=1
MEDRIVSLNVHPLSTDQQQALPEGERTLKRLEAQGTETLVVADYDSGIKGDLLYYMGRWYECVSAQPWDHTILCHTNYQFVLVPSDGARSTDTANPPDTDPNGSDSKGSVWQPELPAASADNLGFVRVPEDSGLVIDEEGYLSIKGGDGR